MANARERRKAFFSRGLVATCLGVQRTSRRSRLERRHGFEKLEKREVFALASPPDELFGLTSSAVAIQLGFIDDDGRNDLVALESNGDLSVALNNGDDTWRQVKLSSLNVSAANGLTLARINSDPFLDVIVQGSDEIVVAFGDGEGGFTQSQSLTPAAAGELTASGQSIGVLATLLDSDAYTDLAIVVPDTDELLVYLGQANGSFGAPTRYASGGDTPLRAVAGNFVGNVASDIAIAHDDGSLTFFRGDATGAMVLQSASTVTGLGSVTGLAVADVDEDGEVDLIHSSSTAARVLINPEDSLAASPILNGDFALGLAGWTATGGAVTAATGAAQLQESASSLLSTLEQTFVIPSGAQSLSFDVTDLGLEIPTAGLADAFEVSLLGADGESLIPTFHVDATSFYNVGPDSAASLASGVTQLGNRITVSLAGLAQGTSARLIFDLIGNPNGQGSAASIDNVSILPSENWGTTFSTTSVPGPFTNIASLAVGDADNDGNVDILISDQGAAQIVVCHGNGAGTFTRWTYNLSTFGSGAGAIATASLTDGDSLLDVAVALSGVPGVLTPLDYQPVVESDIFRVPGSPGELTELTFTWTVRDAGFNNELGFFIVDDLMARVDGLAPGDAGYIQAAIGSPRRQVVFAASQTQGAVTRVTLPAGTLVTPYLVQNDSTGDLLRDNPTGAVNSSPLVWFLHGAANTDGHNHFVVDVLPDGRVQYGVEDQTHTGDGDFNDMIFTLSAAPGEQAPNHRFSVVDDTSVATFRYDPDGMPVNQTGLATGNTRPRDITTNLAANKYWVIDANKWVYVYNPIGELLGSWQPTGLTTPTGIATDGTDIWIVDAGNDRVRKYPGAASRLSGSQAASTTFNLSSGNTNPSGITTNGTKFWVTDEGNDRVYVYNALGQGLGNWQLASGNNDPSGLTINPAGGDDLWVVDRQDNRVYYYDGGRVWTTGQHAYTSTFNLSAANRKPEGIADPPTPISLSTQVNATISANNEVDEYTFTVAAGQLAYFDMISLTGVFWTTVSWKLLDPNGNAVFDYFVFDDRDTIELTTAGTYTLQVKGTQSGANYSFQVVDVPATTTTAISLDTTQTDSFTTHGQAKNYTFNVSAGQLAFFDLISLTGAHWSSVKWKLVDPNGATVFDYAVIEDRNTLELVTAGTYTLHVKGVQAGANYSFQVVDVPATTTTPISLDATQSGTFTAPGQTKNYTFSANAGQRLYLDAITPTNINNGMHWELKGPGGSVIVSYRAYSSDIDHLVLPSTGTYTLRTYSSVDNLSYSFRVIDVPAISSTSIDVDVTYSSQLTKMGESDELSFTGAVGQQIFLQAITPTSIFAGVTWQLTSPTGAVVVSNRGYGDVENFTLSESGTYKLLLHGTADNTNYSFQVVEVPPVLTTPIDFNTTYYGAISRPGESDEYTFTATAGQQLYFRDPAGTNPSWRLVGPSGVVFNWTSGAWEGAMPQTGLYTLTVDGSTDSIPSYDFAVYEVATTNEVPLVLGATIDGTISTPGEKDRYTFTATAGQQLTFDSIIGSTFSLAWRLFSPSGTQVFPSDSYTDRGPLTLVAGEYTLEVDGRDANIPAYQFRVTEVAPPVVTEIELGELVDDTIATSGEVHRYVFSADAGQHVFFDHHSGPFNGFTAKLEGPSGQVWTQGTLADRDTFVLAIGGEYVLTVTPNVGVTGDFSFTLQDVPTPTPVPLILGQTVAGAISVPGEEDRFQFVGQTGDRLFLDILENNGLYPRGFALYRSNGTSVFSPTVTAQDKPLFTLPANDTYTLVVGDSNLLDSTGEYRFRLVSVPADLSLPAAWQTNYSDFVVPGQAIEYTFSATAGQGVLVDLTNPGGVPFTLLGPSSQVIFTGESTDQWIDSLPATGTYTLILGGSGSDKQGPLSFRLQDNVAPEIGVPDTMGTDFWVAFPSIGRSVWDAGTGSEQWLDITAEVATSGTVSIPGVDWFSSFEVVPGQTTRILLPQGTEIPLLGAEVTSVLGVRITALDEVAVYGMNYKLAISDAIQAFPVDALGVEYLALGHPNTGFGFNAYLNSSHFAVVATVDGTTVTITPTATTGSRTAGVPYNIYLDAGDVYQLTNQQNPGDLSGSVITADEPIAVFGGNAATTVPFNVKSANQLFEQLPPIETWGREFYTVPYATRLAGDRFRILAGHDDTDVSINGAVVATLDRGQVYDALLTSASEIVTTKGAMVVQISQSTNADFVYNADPFYSLVPAAEQFQLQHVTTTPSAGFLDHYLNVVVPTVAIDQVQLDGQPIAGGTFAPIGATGFSSAQIPVSPGRHVVSSTHAIGVVAYGYGVQDGYGYIAGTSLADISEVHSLDLTPASTTVPVGSQHIVTATILDDSSNPLPGVLVNFTVTGGSPTSGSAITNALGQAQFTITASAIGSSTISASSQGLTDTATVTWSDTAPVIAVDSPVPGSELIENNSYLLTGQASPGTPLGSIVDVTVNGLSVEALDQAGRFFIRVPITLGTNNFTIVATRADGVTGSTAVSYTGIAAPSPGIDLDDLSDAGGVATFTSTGTFYNRVTRQLHSAVRITNQGDNPLRGPIVALVDRIVPASVILDSTPDGTAIDGRHQIIFDSEFTGALAPGDSTGGVWLTFDVPANERFALDLSLLGQANRSPVIGSVPQLEAVVGVEYSYSIAATDQDGDSLEYRLLTGPDGMEISSGGEVTWTPLLAQTGEHSIEIEVRDSREGVVRQRFTIQARNAPDNRAPIFQSAPVTYVASAGNYLYQPQAFDLEGHSLTWGLTSSPGTMSINSTTGEITWVGATVGNHPITIEADDGHGGIATQSFVLSVGSPSPNLGAPILRSTPPTDGAVDVLYAHQVWADDPEGGPLTYSLIQKPTGMSIDSTGRITWTPTSGQTGPNTVELVVDDGSGGIASAIYTINVVNPLNNRGPQFTSQPGLLATINSPYQYQVTAKDPEGDAVTLILFSGHQDMVFDSATGVLSWTPTATGPQLVRFRAQDAALKSSWQTFLINVRPANVAPFISTGPITTVTAGTTYRYDVDATDEADGFTFSLVNPPAGMQIDSQSGLIWWQPTTPDLGPHDMLVRVTDDRGAVREQQFTLTVTSDVSAPTVNIVRSAESVEISEAVDLQVFATDNLGVSSVALTVNGTPVSLNGQNQGTFTPVAAGIYTVVATATDAASNIGTATFRLKVTDPADVVAPTVTLTSPSANTVITYLTDLVGTIQDTNLDSWRVEYARLDTSEFRVLAEGTTNITASAIATFDPTMLQNDQYIVRIVATDISGNSTTLERPIEVTGNAKLGQFRQEFTDLTIPLAGIPITITRIYDSLASNESGDFGYGWTLGVREANIRETVRQNPLEPLAGIFATTAFREGTRVYLNAPDGRRVGFTFTPTVETGFFGDLYRPKFTADPGVFETLTVEDIPLTKAPDGYFQLYFANFNYNPREYTLTTKDQRIYRYDQFDGLQDVTDRNGNKLTYTPSGIFHSSGESIEFVRDDQGRITEIVDPAGNSLHYTYDGRGDLITFRNQENLGTNFDYYDDPAHYLREVTSDCGCTSYFRTEYDDAGRVIAVYDALGNPAETSYDLQNHTEIIADREGNETIVIYDSRGNIMTVTDPLGSVTAYTYDANDNLTSTVDARGYLTEFSYDSRGNLTEIVDAEGGVFAYTYNTRNDISTVRDAEGRLSTYVYDVAGNVTEFTNALGVQSYMSRDNRGRMASMTDNNGNTTTYAYGDSDSPTVVTNADLSTKLFTYNAFGEVTLAINENGDETTYAYDRTGRPLVVSDDQDNEITFAYDDKLLASISDPLGRISRFRYDDLERLTQTIDALGGVTTISYDRNGHILAQMDPLGHAVVNAYDALGRLVSTTDALGYTSRYEYDAAGNRLLETDANGSTTRFEYDGLNRLIKRTNPYGFGESFTYDAVGNLTSATDELGNQAFYFYDDLNRLIRSIDFEQGEELRDYDYHGNLTSLTNANNQTTTFEYNNRNRLIEQHDAADNVVYYSYDYAGNLTSYTDQLGKVTTFVYDSRGHRTEVIDAETGSTKFTYDSAGNLTSVVDAIDRDTSYEYDALNRLKAVTDPRSGVTEFTYDAAGNRTSVKDPVDHVTTFLYDANHRLVAHVDPLQRSTTYGYDATGNVIETVDRNGRRRTFEYDLLDRQVAERWWSAEAEVHTIEFVYDAADRLQSAEDSFSKYAYTHDALGRILSVDNDGTAGAPNVVLNYTYDAVGNVLAAADNLGVSIVSTYDSRNLLETRTWNGGGIAARGEFTYNDRHERIELARFSDTSGTNRIGRTTYDYDDVGRKSDIVHRDATDAVLIDYDYVFDLAGQLASEAHHGQASTYLHDGSGQLISANHSLLQDETFSYDLNGNRDSTGYVTGPNNQLVSDGEFEYAYDGEGSLIAKTEVATGIIVRFEYDHRNRLTAVRSFSSDSSGAPTKEVLFTYDVFDRRILKTVDSDGDGPLNSVAEYFVYDGEHIWADFDDAGSVVARYLFSDTVDEVLARFRPGDGVAWHLADHLGSVRDIVDSSGDVINHIEYDSFGSVVAEAAPAYGDRIKFTGREFDPESGLYYYRARYYDPANGRFTSQDPIGFEAGDANLYRYVSNSPLVATDPTGLTSIGFSAGALAYDLQLAEGMNGFTFGYACGFLDAFYSGDPNPTGAAMIGAVAGYAIGRALNAAPIKHALMFSVAFALVGANSIAQAAYQGNQPLTAVRTVCFTAPLARTGIRYLSTRAPQVTASALNSALLQRYLRGNGGRWGRTATRQLNHRLATDFESKGFTVTGGAGRAGEEWFAGPGGGTKGGTFVDITVTDGAQTIRIQTVSTRADGVTPIPNEVAAAARIRARFPSDQLILVSKRTGKVIP